MVKIRIENKSHPMELQIVMSMLEKQNKMVVIEVLKCADKIEAQIVNYEQATWIVEAIRSMTSCDVLCYL